MRKSKNRYFYHILVSPGDAPGAITRMHGSAIRCVRIHDQSIWKNRKFDPPPRKYKMDKYIQTPPRIYDYVAELSCCAQSEQNRLTQFCWGNRRSLSFLLTHTGSQTNSFISPTNHKYGRIWNIYGSKRVVSRPNVPFWGIVDDKSCLGVQIPQNPFLRTIQCKNYYTLCFKKKFTLLLFAITKSDVDRFQ